MAVLSSALLAVSLVPALVMAQLEPQVQGGVNPAFGGSDLTGATSQGPAAYYPEVFK